MESIISFLVSVMASVIAYYICKWLDGKTVAISQMKTPENGLSGVFACELHGYNFISGYRYCSICKNVFQYAKSEKQHKNFFTSYI